MKYLPLYYKWMEKGAIPGKGLCRIFKEDNLFKCFSGWGYWGYDGREIYTEEIKEYGLNREKVFYKFTPIRQNVVLLLAALNNEL